MNFMKLLNEFLAGILVMVFHVFVGAFMDRSSMAFLISMYIFVLTMIRITGMPIEEETGQIKEEEMDFRLS